MRRKTNNKKAKALSPKQTRFLDKNNDGKITKKDFKILNKIKNKIKNKKKKK